MNTERSAADDPSAHGAEQDAFERRRDGPADLELLRVFLLRAKRDRGAWQAEEHRDDSELDGARLREEAVLLERRIVRDSHATAPAASARLDGLPSRRAT